MRNIIPQRDTAAIEFIRSVGLEAVAAHERSLLDHATAALSAVPGLRLVGTAPEKTAVLSFVLDGIHPHDVGTILDGRGVAVRTGHHCAMPVMQRFGISGTARASLALYNNREDIDRLVEALNKAREIFG